MTALPEVGVDLATREIESNRPALPELAPLIQPFTVDAEADVMVLMAASACASVEKYAW